ncbi:MAG: STAS domain-containing protein [Burkholderiales bacterium]|nr:STAS domain-containing protein [Burkholderiales bacterium]MDE2566751.1 STAS domain-containing protein [Burkholderiales bacterium]
MKLPADATLDHAAALAEQLSAALAEQASGPLRIDASPLQNFDSSTLALLLQARRLAAAAGRELELSGLPPQLRQLAQLYRVDGLLWPSDPLPAEGPPPRPASA